MSKKRPLMKPCRPASPGQALSKRLAVYAFWTSHADNLEKQAIALFRQAGVARSLAGQAQTLPNEAIDRVYDEMQKVKAGPSAKKSDAVVVSVAEESERRH